MLASNKQAAAMHSPAPSAQAELQTAIGIDSLNYAAICMDTVWDMLNERGDYNLSQPMNFLSDSKQQVRADADKLRSLLAAARHPANHSADAGNVVQPIDRVQTVDVTFPTPPATWKQIADELDAHGTSFDGGTAAGATFQLMASRVRQLDASAPVPVGRSADVQEAITSLSKIPTRYTDRVILFPREAQCISHYIAQLEAQAGGNSWRDGWLAGRDASADTATAHTYQDASVVDAIRALTPPVSEREVG